MRFVCLVLVLYGTEMSYSMVVNREGKVTFSDVDVTAIKDTLRSEGNRENDLFGGLTNGVTKSGDKVALAKHHIIPEGTIRSELKTLADDVRLKEKLEKYVNHENNRICRQTYLEFVPIQNRDDINEVSKYFRPIVSWNPNNLRAGPLGNERARDPGSDVDTEIATKWEQDMANGSKNILDKLTELSTPTNPTWEKTRRGPNAWTVKNKTGASYSVIQLVKRNNDDDREFNIEDGTILG